MKQYQSFRVEQAVPVAEENSSLLIEQEALAKFNTRRNSRVKPDPKETRDLLRHHRLNNPCKFENLSEMKQQHAAIQKLRDNGYSQEALREIGKQFLESVEYALRDYNSMKEDIEEIVNY